jgi:predicted amidohydrolase YtcJ
VQGFPIHDSLSRVSPRNPVWLTHASGHAGFANALALEQAGVTRATRDPAGGEIVRDVQGNATGALKEAAQGLVRPRSSSPSRGREYAALAGQECLSKGITSFQDAGNGPDVIDMYRSLAKEGKLEVRLWVMLRAPTSRLAELMPRYRAIDKQVTVRAIKRMIDGALGPRGAWLLAPYSDLPGSTGLNTEDPNDLRRAAGIALANDYQVCVHAIGDRANRETLDIFDRVLAGRRDLRWRIEHAQHISAADIPRFAKLGVIASMQAIHCTSDAPYVLARLGPARAEEGAYVWRSLMRTGAVVTNGTDAPVEDVDPLRSRAA